MESKYKKFLQSFFVLCLTCLGLFSGYIFGSLAPSMEQYGLHIDSSELILKHIYGMVFYLVIVVTVKLALNLLKYFNSLK